MFPNHQDSCQFMDLLSQHHNPPPHFSSFGCFAKVPAPTLHFPPAPTQLDGTKEEEQTVLAENLFFSHPTKLQWVQGCAQKTPSLPWEVCFPIIQHDCSKLLPMSAKPLHCPPVSYIFHEGANTNKSLRLPPPHFNPASTSTPAFLESHPHITTPLFALLVSLPPGPFT